MGGHKSLVAKKGQKYLQKEIYLLRLLEIQLSLQMRLSPIRKK